MKLLLIGSGGREHAIAWKLSKSSKVSKIYVAPGNGGTAIENKCENINITDIDELAKFAKKNNIYLTIVGPEDPLTKGITDKFKAEGLRIFGPDKAGAQLEGSKSFSKDFMEKYGVKTAQYAVFTDSNKALEYLETCEYPTVIKADGLAAGKGVSICFNKEEAIAMAKMTLDTILLKNGYVNEISAFLGKQVVIKRDKTISCSIGVSISTNVDSNSELSKLIKNADSSLYSVKHTTKKAVKFFVE